MSEAVLSEFLQKALKPYNCEFWGSNYHVVPALVDRIWGDGQQAIKLWPISQRPHHYIVRLDSKMGVGSDEFIELIDEIESTIEEEFGVVEWEDEDGNPLEGEDIASFPAVNFCYGSTWRVLKE